ncbi:aldo/keto reductases [Candidatus Termititenax persephonae]|uniref:Aldo/keto reductases n=1 Tax=Candidatus Termititenax persephonae TaxID=2218525 RepID=A0A388TF54_9BACT|nr:aldo/keto reductases [Candidatus Termititenax persephonae]
MYNILAGQRGVAVQTYKLNNGLEIPAVGFGTWQTPAGEVTVKSVREALRVGYTHIDTAAAYENEASVGKAIRESGLPREKLFITTKLWNSDRGYDRTLAAFDWSLKELKLDYLDLYLIHWPDAKDKEKNISSWQALERLCKEGRVKTIGVSNFKQQHLQPLLDAAEIKPAVNQIEYHPGFRQPELVDFCRQNDILIEAWSPLGSGRILQDKNLQAIAQKYNKSVAQICLRWCLQNGTLPLPKSVTPARIKENYQVCDFVIAAEDLQFIDALPEFGWSGLNPDSVPF